MGRKDVDILSITKEKYFDGSETFGAEQGLNFAVAVLDTFEDGDYELDPAYGRIQFKQNKIYEDEGSYKFDYITIESHKCTREELGLSEGVNRFWPIQES